MFPISTKQGGTCVAFPDVCKTQVGPATTPLPYPNMSQTSSLKKGTGSKRTVIGNKAIVLKKSILGTSSGDEPGALKGLVSNNNKGEVKFTRGENGVKVEKSPVVYLTVPTQQNCSSGATNVPGVNIKPGQRHTVLKMVGGKKVQVQVKRRKFHKAGRKDTSNKGAPAVSSAAGGVSKAMNGTSSKAVSKASEALGDAGAVNGINGFANSCGTSVVGRRTFRGRNTVDMIARFKDGTLCVVEAKGGAGGLCSRMANGVRAQQGTPRYLESVAQDMANSTNARKRKAGQELLQALKKPPPRVLYVHAKTPYTKTGTKPVSIKVKDTRWRPFDP